MKRNLGVVAIAAMLCVGTPLVETAGAASVMVIEDFAPMRMIPSARSPRKAYAPLGMLLQPRRTAKGGEFVEATNGEEQPFEDPAWLHYWIYPKSILAEPGQTRVGLELIVRREGDDADAAAGRRYSVAEFIADSTALPDTYYVAAGDPADRSAWGGRASILSPAPEPYDPPGSAERKEALRAADAYRLAISLSGDRKIAYVRERVAAARVLVAEPRCADYEYVETEVVTLADRKRTIGDLGGTSMLLVPASDITSTRSAGGVLWTRVVYVADVYFEDGTSETVARRLLVTWPLCP
jgi:hypothetical protein